MLFRSLKNKEGASSVVLKDIYVELEKKIKEENLTEKYKLDTFRNTIRGEINAFEEETENKNIKLFRRVGLATYSLTDNGEKYNER